MWRPSAAVAWRRAHSCAKLPTPPTATAALCATARGAASRAAASRQWGVVLDIDGVVVRGSRLIPGSAEAVRMLREERVPYAFMTNGGGVKEAAKARELSELLGDPLITEAEVMLSHTPMRSLAQKYRGRRVLVVGSKDTLEVARGYGFDGAVTPAQVAAGTAGICPRESARSRSGDLAVDVNADGVGIDAVLIFHDPSDWSMELQVLTDAIAGGVPLGAPLCAGPSGAAPVRQAVQVYASNPDFVWQAAYPVPRFGQGAFLDCLRALWRRLSGGSELRVTEFGKPHKLQFDAVRELLQRSATGALRRLYMVGDNPAADVRGANGAGDPWRSILVCTGVYQGGPSGNAAGDPAWRVEPDLRAAVERLLRAPDGEHLA